MNIFKNGLVSIALTFNEKPGTSPVFCLNNEYNLYPVLHLRLMQNSKEVTESFLLFIECWQFILILLRLWVSINFEIHLQDSFDLSKSEIHPVYLLEQDNQSLVNHSEPGWWVA
ncbi:hypothetical protein EV194_101219 [Natronoflexus pectinivorans]|uniref:Uncharacterized protein n=1 Tax=Natronoflexus pectinivorans TaxID=682526 RepID=A0A4R2GPF3_9BACT|nr:hypothetical protein EV194_101219 [Natronoflexus pectinivorans]